MRKAVITVAIVVSHAAAFWIGGYFPKRDSANSKSLALNIVDGGVYRVRTAVDGDTVVFENGLHLRYNGVNAPESGRFVKDYSPMSKEATAKNIELVEGKRVRVKLAEQPLDMHGRVVGNLFVVPDDPRQPEIDVRQTLLKGGYAKAMGLGVPGDEYATLKAWQDEAKAAEMGMWGVKNQPRAPEEIKPYCAASTSKTYHRADCGIAKRISPVNLHGYATVEEAQAVGLKPCGSCMGGKVEK